MPLTPQTALDIGSIAKQFTAAAILLLAQDGKLSVDDNVRKFIPEMPDYGTPITLRHLLHHTSGVRDYIFSARGTSTATAIPDTSCSLSWSRG